MQPNNRTLKHTKQNLTEKRREINNSAITIEDFNTPLSIVDGTTRHKISSKTQLECTINQLT